MSGQMPRILVIDDDTSVRIAIKAVLEREGFDVSLFEDGRATALPPSTRISRPSSSSISSCPARR
jgi:CheY-like chemotaxis protein